MKKKLSTIMMLLASLLPMNAQNLQKGDYGYLYCHMSDKGLLPFLVMDTTIRISMKEKLFSILKSMLVLRAVHVMLT